jgi:hypothetical protein
VRRDELLLHERCVHIRFHDGYVEVKRAQFEPLHPVSTAANGAPPVKREYRRYSRRFELADPNFDVRLAAELRLHGVQLPADWLVL